MPTLLEINVDTLFEQHSVSEIDQIHKKLQNDVEQKKEELRTMVGERYRDLLKAADAIANMRNTASTVTVQVQGIIACCQTLNEHQLIGFKTERAPVNRIAERMTNTFYGIAEQIKLLTQLPELMWAAVDKEDYFVATQLFIFARHINTGLNLDINKPVMKSFPVAAKLWTILSSFYMTIKQACLAALERQHLTTEVAAKCLASIMLLENCQLEKLLTTFIKLRTKAFKQTLLDTSTVPHQRVKQKLLTSVHILIDTIVLLYKCLIDNGKGANGQLMDELNRLSATDAQQTIALMNAVDGTLMNYMLPEIISKFKPSVEIAPLCDTTLKTVMQSWLKYTAQDADHQLKSLIDVITSIRTIHFVKSEALAIVKPPNWQEMLEKLYLPTNLDLYKFYYQPLFSRRIEEIIKTALAQNIFETHDVIVGHLRGQQKATGKTGGRTQMIWTEEPGDIPLSLKQALSTERQSHKLLLKIRGYTPTIVQICESLDGNMQTLFSELKLYLSHDMEPDDVDVGKDIAAYLRTSSRESVLALITNIKTIDFGHTQCSLIFIATLLHGITELCPNLQLCIQHDTSVGQQLGGARAAVEQWDNVRRLLNEESLQFWKQWISLFIDQHLTGDDQKLCFNITDTLTGIMKEFCTWDSITIEEKDDSDQPIQSVIRIPAQPSISLQQFLFRICQQLHKIVPHTLPKPVTVALVDRIATELCRTYDRLAAIEFVRQNQAAALQYFFDIRFVALMLCTRESKLIADRLQTVSASFRSNVDPFDFELFHKYLLANVKKCGFRMQHKLGSIVPNVELLATLLGQQTAATLHEKDPNVLALSTTSSETSAGWFPMLPVVVGLVEKIAASPSADSGGGAAGCSVKHPAKVKKSTTHQSTLPSTTITTQNVRAGAAAFFGAMSQDWFR